MDLLDELLEAWRYTREGVIAEAQNLPPEHLYEMPCGTKRTALDLVNHIVESGWLMAGELSRPDGDFKRKSNDELTAEHTPTSDYSKDMASAIEALRRSHAQGDAKLRAAGLVELMKPIRQFNGVPASRISWMHHGVSHEEYHRGQLALYARLLGAVPALTKVIYGPGAS
jgi:uncharacterized damage-inducible protein DinB